MSEDGSAPRRRGMVGVHSLDHFRLVVPDLRVAADFYARFGLSVEPAGAELTLSAAEMPHRWARLGEGTRKALDYLSFGAYPEDLPVFRERLPAQGIAVMPAPRQAVDDTGLWFRDPDGIVIEIRVGAKVSPNRKSLPTPSASFPGVASAPLRVDSPIVRPRRLSHVLVFTSDVPRAVTFYRDVLGLGLSDSAGDGIAFMHGIHGSDHHLVAFAKSDAAGFHHCSWDVGSVNDIGLGAMRMADAGHSAGWGLGRHVLGSNYFHYVRDPWGSYSEYSHDIDYIPGDGSWRASDVSPDNGFYLWGPAPPADFAFNYESPAAELTRELVASEPG
jgi:catechol 2,3-dioxygenase